MNYFSIIEYGVTRVKINKVSWNERFLLEDLFKTLTTVLAIKEK